MKKQFSFFAFLLIFFLMSTIVFADDEILDMDIYNFETQTWQTDQIKANDSITSVSESSSDSGISPFIIFGEDGRKIVSNTAQKPYSYIGNVCIYSQKAICGYGTGFLVAPSLVLTAAHNVYSQYLDIDAIKFIPGHTEDSYPYGKHDATKFYIPSQYKENPNNPKYDFALIQLKTNVGDTAGYFSLDPNMKIVNDPDKHDINENKIAVSLTGYPQNDKKHMYKSTGNVYFDGGDYLGYYRMDTDKGQSGSPIYYKKDGKYYVVGIHIGKTSTNDWNRCRLMTNAVYTLINKYR